MADDNCCPECRKPLSSAAAPGTYCPRCLLKLGLETETFLGKDGDTEPVDPAISVVTNQHESTHPNNIGPYHLTRKLGEGGMGEVYEAEQQEPVRRKVALKLIKWGMDTRHVVARFEAERQALAMMDHPNIARVYDAGATDQGRPYFVMELVKGVHITDYCDKHKLSTRERLELFALVCEGVQHAHQKGIIHRDIKPSNVLVMIQDDKPVPKIIDFGVAKATEQRLTEKSVFTELGQMIGTPEYMSPEQAEITGLDIDTRTDVYSLGVLLYELLSGALPFEPRELRKAGYDEIRRKIREDQPPKPSTRVSSLGDAATTAASNRATAPGVLVRRLRGDLDWISMKALEKDRTRRYGSAADLAADIARHLQSEPVLAGPPSAVYKMKKFVRRHRFGVTAAGIVLAALVLGVVGTTVGMLRAIAAEGHARMEARRAEASNIFTLGRNLIEEDPSAALAHVIASLELADNPVVREFAMGLVARGPTAFSEDVGQDALRMTFSRDGTWLAAGGWQGLHKLWNEDGSPSRTLKGQGAGALPSVWFSDDGKFHLSADPGVVRVWKLPELKQVRQFDPDGGIDVIGNKLFNFKDLGGWEKLRLRWLPIMDGEVEELGVWPSKDMPWIDVDPGHDWFAYITGKGLFLLPFGEFKTATPRQVGLGSEKLEFFKFHRDGKHIVTADESALIQFWSYPDGPAEAVRSIQAGAGLYNNFLGLDDGGRWVATIDNSLPGTSVWDLEAPPGAEPLVLRRGGSLGAFSLDVHPAGTWIAVGDTLTVSIWPLGGSYTRVLRRQEGTHNEFSSVVFDPDGEWLVSSSLDGKIRFWPLTPDGGEPGRILLDAGTIVGGLSVSPDGEHIAIGGWLGTVGVLPVSGGELRLLRGFGSAVGTAFGPEGRRVAAAGGFKKLDDAYVRIWDLETGEEQVLDAGDNEYIWHLEFTPDGRLLTSGAFGLRLWSLDSGESELLLEGSAYGTLSPDGRSCFGVRAVDPEDPYGPQVAFVLDLEDRVVRELPWPDPWRGVWHPSGKKIVFQDRRGTIQVASIGDDQPHRLVGHKDWSFLAVHPDGQLIASGGSDGTLRLWPMPEGQPVHTLPREEFLDKLRSLTNHRLAADEESITGYRIEFGRLPSWDQVPTW